MRITIIGNQHLETVFFVKRNGGEISVNGKEAKGGTGSFRIQQVLYRPHQFAAHFRASSFCVLDFSHQFLVSLARLFPVCLTLFGGHVFHALHFFLETFRVFP